MKCDSGINYCFEDGTTITETLYKEKKKQLDGLLLAQLVSKGSPR